MNFVSDDEQDLSQLLWGDLAQSPNPAGSESPEGGCQICPSVLNNEISPQTSSAVQVGGSGEHASYSSSTEMSISESLAESAPMEEGSLCWDPDHTPEVPSANLLNQEEDWACTTDEEVRQDSVDPLDWELDIDSLAALVELSADDEFISTHEAARGLDGPLVDNEALTYGELADRWQREVLPRLRWLAGVRRYLTLGDLAEAVAMLQGSESHLSLVRKFAEQTSAAILPSRTHKVGRAIPRWAIEEARRRFGDLVRDQPDMEMVVARLGYSRIPLSKSTRAFLVQAWIGHCLSREEELQHAQKVAAELARHGRNLMHWSPEARMAREALILDNLWLVARNARSFIGRGVEVDDLLQMGVLGLLRAIEKFDPTLGYRFSTYAHWWINQAIARQIADEARLIRLPIHVQERTRAIDAAQARLWQTLQRAPTIAEIAAECGTSEAIVQALLVTSRPVSLDESAIQAELATRMAPSEDPVEHAETADAAALLRKLLETLPDRERAVLELRYGLRDGRPRTLEEVGRSFGVTRERIRQIETKALVELRHLSRTKWIYDYSPISTATPSGALKESIISGVTANQVRRVLDEFTPEDRTVIQMLWGLDHRKPCSIQAVAKVRNLPTEQIKDVYWRTIRLAGSRLDRPISGYETRRIGKERLIRRASGAHHRIIHPGWLLDFCDRDTNPTGFWAVAKTSDLACDCETEQLHNQFVALADVEPDEMTSLALESPESTPTSQSHKYAGNIYLESSILDSKAQTELIEVENGVMRTAGPERSTGRCSERAPTGKYIDVNGTETEDSARAIEHNRIYVRKDGGKEEKSGKRSNDGNPASRLSLIDRIRVAMKRARSYVAE